MLYVYPRVGEWRSCLGPFCLVLILCVSFFFFLVRLYPPPLRTLLCACSLPALSFFLTLCISVLGGRERGGGGWGEGDLVLLSEGRDHDSPPPSPLALEQATHRTWTRTGQEQAKARRAQPTAGFNLKVIVKECRYVYLTLGLLCLLPAVVLFLEQGCVAQPGECKRVT